MMNTTRTPVTVGLSSCAGTARGHALVPAPRGFTLTEMVLVVGAVALLSIAVAQVFSLTSKTVQAGRRLSAVNQAAAAMERQMRADFAALSRDGFMVIRNQLTSANPWDAGGGDVRQMPPVATRLTPTDPSPRVRRVDELLFFAKGDFTTKREPLAPGAVARSNTAMVYYGHGQGQIRDNDIDVNAPAGSGFNTPVRIDDQNAVFAQTNGARAAQMLGVVQLGSPNSYASDWNLLRREVVLATPSYGLRPALTSLGIPLERAQDNSSQIAYQPAVGSVFKVASFVGFFGPFNVRQGGVPQLSSGVVDVAVGDLDAVRDSVLQAARDPFSTGGFSFPGFRNPMRFDISLPPEGTPRYTPSFSIPNGQMQREMLDALPSYSDAGYRMRAESDVPDYLGWRKTVPINDDLQRQDQAMLTSGVFLPRCTEFIVEYSLGLTNAPTPERRTVLGREVPAQPQRFANAPQGLVWHGIERLVPADPSVDPATVNLNTDALSLTVPYGVYFRLNRADIAPYQLDQDAQPWRGFDRRSPVTGYFYSVPVTTRGGRTLELAHPVLPQSIEFGGDYVNTFNTRIVYASMFGYVDATWTPEIGQRRRADYTVTLSDETRREYKSQAAFLGEDDSVGVNRLTWFDPTCVVNNPVIYNVPNGNRVENPVTYDPNRGDIRAWELVKDVNGDGLYNPSQGDAVRFNQPTTMPAVWPKLVRVTYSVADPSDPSFEQTFQIILEVPAGTQLPTY